MDTNSIIDSNQHTIENTNADAVPLLDIHAHQDTNPHPDDHLDVDPDSNAHSDANENLDRNGYSAANGDADENSHANRNAVSVTHTDENLDRHRNSAVDPDTNPYGNADTNLGCYGYPAADTHQHADANAHPNQWRRRLQLRNQPTLEQLSRGRWPRHDQRRYPTRLLMERLLNCNLDLRHV